MLKTTIKRSLLVLAGVCTSLAVTLATPGQALAAAAVQPALQPLPTVWPRDFDSAQQRIELYQPQVEVWQGNRIEGRAAFAVGAKDATPNYGVAHFTARAEVDKTRSIVQLLDIVFGQVDMPATPSAAAGVKTALQARIPKDGLTTSLEQLQASYASTHEGGEPGIAVQNNVPNIIFAERPTLLVLVDGDANWRALGDTHYQRLINTRAMLLKDASGVLHLNVAGYWYEAKSLDGPWHLNTAPPHELVAAAKNAQTNLKSDPMLPADGKKPAQAPDVVVAAQPAELVVTNGKPALQPVKGVNLLSVTNADHALFVEPRDNHYYLLLSGRWFSAATLNGPWTFVDGKSLPGDFAKIAADDPHANALVSVPGTPQAKEAAIAATIPQTATVSRKTTTLKVVYDGSPKFVGIAGTSLSYAVNTATPVIQTAPSQFFAVANGIWFTASAASGPWLVADTVPASIYAIPAASPVHYVTYVHVYSATPDTVVVGYTPGYMGVVVNADGTVVYGTGYVYAPYVGDVYYGYPATYGYGAGFALGTTVGFAFGFAIGATWGAPSPYWGPYWGGGPWSWQYANVNQANIYGRWGQGTVTHASGWNGWTGNSWAGTAASGFNPYTGGHFQASRGAVENAYNGNFAAGRQGSFSNPSTGRSGAARGGVVGNEGTGDYAAGRQRAGYNAQTGRYGAAEAGVTGNAYSGNHQAGTKGIVGNKDTGKAVAWNNGNVYAGSDGNVYRHDQGGGWEQHSADGWQPVQPNAGQTQRLDSLRQGHDLGNARASGQFQPQRHFGGGGGRFRR
ncbi:hypothetical protein R70006_00133 [Paraburkholderia domus]|uniref:carbohydrate-binding family V/XII n=1 Tax=Paraburkholderia domus TaxID=2793075 RepID=UPI001B162B64|nr:carbohydrate-binding family V/XII [Paraburkholderia domus]CAE6686867.1 hypothetical protein R70006_00133 [Paraburkholderia domus]